MNDFDRSLRSFGLDPLRVRQSIEKGDARRVLAVLQKEEEMLRLRSIELADLRETICELDFKARRVTCGELSDEDMEMLSAAGLRKKELP